MMSEWRVSVNAGNSTKDWDALDTELRSKIERDLSLQPFYDPFNPKCRKHLKGKILGKNRECHREYRDLPAGWRLFYTVDKDRRVVRIEYVGPHQK